MDTGRYPHLGKVGVLLGHRVTVRSAREGGCWLWLCNYGIRHVYEIMKVHAV